MSWTDGQAESFRVKVKTCRRRSSQLQVHRKLCVLHSASNKCNLSDGTVSTRLRKCTRQLAHCHCSGQTNQTVHTQSPPAWSALACQYHVNASKLRYHPMLGFMFQIAATKLSSRCHQGMPTTRLAGQPLPLLFGSGEGEVHTNSCHVNSNHMPCHLLELR